MTALRPAIAVAIPAHNEADQIGKCLAALQAQCGVPDFKVVVLANNCHDETASIAHGFSGLDIHVVEHRFPPSQANAGHARRAAMAIASRFGEIILTTDGDCVPDKDWVLNHVAAFESGAQAVAGRVSANWDELQTHPRKSLEIGALEWEYLRVIGDAQAIFDPRPHDPAPRHAQMCGANIGITREMLSRIGGVPPLVTGEDRALLNAVESLDGRVRYAREPHVTASARLIGRANGGMADALAARECTDYYCDEQFDLAENLVDRWRARHRARHAWNSGAKWVCLSDIIVNLNRSISCFGMAWTSIEAQLFPQTRLQPIQLPQEIAHLKSLCVSHV